MLGKGTTLPAWVFWAVMIGDGLSAVLQVPFVNYYGFGLTPLHLLAVETATYLLVGYIVLKTRVNTSKYLFYVSLPLAFAACILPLAFPLPGDLAQLFQIVAYVSLSVLNVCWAACFASFKPALAAILVLGAYIIWSAYSYAFWLLADGHVAMAGRSVIPFVSLVVLGFCINAIERHDDARKSEKGTEDGSLLSDMDIRDLFVVTLAIFFIFGCIMQLDVAKNGSYSMADDAAQVFSIMLSIAFLAIVLWLQKRLDALIVGVVAVAAIVLAVILSARTIFGEELFLTSGLPFALFNLFGEFVWIAFAWKAYAFRGNPLPVMAFGLGAMRFGLLLGRSAIEFLSRAEFLSKSLTNLVSVVSLWVLFLALAIVAFVFLRKGGAEKYLRVLRGAPSSSAVDSCETDTERFRAVASRSKDSCEAFLGANLTDREIEILYMYAGGRSATHIASDLQLSSHTVKTHIRRAYAKLDIHSRQQLLDLIEKR